MTASKLQAFHVVSCNLQTGIVGTALVNGRIVSLHFGAHRSDDNRMRGAGGWVLTHLGSGAKVDRVRSLRAAEVYASFLEGIPGATWGAICKSSWVLQDLPIGAWQGMCLALLSGMPETDRGTICADARAAVAESAPLMVRPPRPKSAPWHPPAGAVDVRTVGKGADVALEDGGRARTMSTTRGITTVIKVFFDGRDDIGSEYTFRIASVLRGGQHVPVAIPPSWEKRIAAIMGAGF